MSHFFKTFRSWPGCMEWALNLGPPIIHPKLDPFYIPICRCQVKSGWVNSQLFYFNFLQKGVEEKGRLEGKWVFIIERWDEFLDWDLEDGFSLKKLRTESCERWNHGRTISWFMGDMESCWKKGFTVWGVLMGVVWKMLEVIRKRDGFD